MENEREKERGRDRAKMRWRGRGGRKMRWERNIWGDKYGRTRSQWREKTPTKPQKQHQSGMGLRDALALIDMASEWHGSERCPRAHRHGIRVAWV